MAKGAQPPRTARRPAGRPPFDCIALLLQGGGALGAYQAGVYQALAEAGLHPDWVAGISIGAINAAIIAGNAPDRRVEKLREFWEGVTPAGPWAWMNDLGSGLFKGDSGRNALNQMNASMALLGGVPGFFTPRLLSPWLQPAGAVDATSYYDTRALETTLERLVDFDRINAGGMRFSVGAVNVTTGNFAYFDTETHTITARHILASGALPPGFPSIEIDGDRYWDGGLVSNTPLQWVLHYGPRQDTLAFQVDLWSAQGEAPRNMTDVATRVKDILYSSRTRDNTDRFKDQQAIRHVAANLLKDLPAKYRTSPEFAALNAFADRKVYSIVHLIHRAERFEGDSKDYEFSRLAMQEHWRAGHQATERTLRHPQALQRPANLDGLATFDIADHHAA